MSKNTNYRQQWAEGEIEAGTLLDAIDTLHAEAEALRAENARLVERAGYLVEFAQQMARQQGEPYYQKLAKAALKKWSRP